jgi:tetratricopeptide (TPR) repeat protein
MPTTSAKPVFVFLLSWTALLAVPASAQTGTGLTGNASAPWEHNVSKERQQKAEQLFQEANAYMKEGRFPAAEAKYREALGVWEHPAIDFNLAQLLFRQGNLLAVHHHITRALRYGEAALGETRFKRALDLQASVERQLSRVEITCDVPGASVWLDEKQLLSCPGRSESFELPGIHTLSTRKDGYPPNDRPRTLTAGKTTRLHIERIYDAPAMHVKTSRWPVWIPWTLVGTGVAVAGGGGFLHLKARSSYQRFDERVSRCGATGCPPDPSLDQMVRRGDTFQWGALGAYAVGGAIATAGTVLVLLNRESSVDRTPDEIEGVKFGLVAGHGEGAVLATWRF